MSSSTPVNLAALEAKQAQRAAKQILADQVLSKDRMTEQFEEGGFNPIAAARAQSRLGRFRPLESRRRTPDVGHARIEGVEKKTEEDLAHEFNKRNPELPIGRLRTLRQRVHNNSSEQEILDMVADFDDPTLADEALDYLDQTTSGDLQTKVRRARDLLHAEKGREIVAGRNIDPAAKAFFEKGLAESPTELRNLYRDITNNPRENHNALFSELSARYSFDDLKKVVAFLLQGLSFDLKSKGPSIQQAELILLMSEVKDLQSILWVYLFFKGRLKLIRKMFKNEGIPFAKALTFEKLAKEFIKLVEERYPTVMKLLKMLEELGLIDSAKVIVLSQYREAIRMFSLRVYKSTRHQQDLLSLVIEALTELEEEEEE